MKLLFLLLLPLAARAQTPLAGRPARSFIPANYHELPDGRASGDLNRDGRPDLALVLAPTAEDTVAKGDGDSDGLPPRRLLVLLAAPGGGYQLAGQSRRAVLCKGCGGQYDPFEGLSITNGILSLDQMGGGSQRWGITSKFRYQQGSFYLIGETTSRTDPGPECSVGSSEDANYLTGAYETTTTGTNCEETVRRRRLRLRPLCQLASYEPTP